MNPHVSNAVNPSSATRHATRRATQQAILEAHFSDLASSKVPNKKVAAGSTAKVWGREPVGAGAFESEELLGAWMQTHGVNASEWGTDGVSKPLGKLWRELEAREALLTFDDVGMLRLARVAKVRHEGWSDERCCTPSQTPDHADFLQRCYVFPAPLLHSLRTVAPQLLYAPLRAAAGADSAARGAGARAVRDETEGGRWLDVGGQDGGAAAVPLRANQCRGERGEGGRAWGGRCVGG